MVGAEPCVGVIIKLGQSARGWESAFRHAARHLTCSASPYLTYLMVFLFPAIAGTFQDGYLEARVVGPKSFGIEP